MRTYKDVICNMARVSPSSSNHRVLHQDAILADANWGSLRCHDSAREDNGMRTDLHIT